MIADTQFTWAAVKVFTLVLNTVSCFGTCHILQSRAYSKDIQPEIELCLWILPSILCSNARAPVAQLVRTSDWHSEERIDDNTQKTQVQILVGSQCLFQEQTINISSHRAVTYILGSQLYLMLCWESEKYIYRKNSGIQLGFEPKTF